MTESTPQTSAADAESPMVAAAQKLLNDRMGVIPPLAQTLARRKHLEQLVSDNEREYGTLYADAQAAGWSAEELAQMGATEPTLRPPGRPRKNRVRRQPSTAPTTPAPRTPEPSESPSEPQASPTT
ncbi:hypothetical protein [Streptomyces yaizuensis]|uniref:Uncharacterized protein n=1 Tax=Streptomyces yaizuensis TaxID=2989713 RepID=A0AA86J426_9ACTN|nr:hypothetical protein [Streptomyces sp. YSPA8]BDT39687.1 hypothetical protein SYYSPA8_37845 [Streptomyces sp. YSPA8]